MNYYSTEPRTVPQLLRATFSCYRPALRAAFWFLILIVLFQNSSFLLGYVIQWRWFVISILLIIGLLSLFLWSSALYAVHQSLKNQPGSFISSLVAVLQRFVPIILFALLYLGFFIVMLFWMGFVNHRLLAAPSLQPALWWLDLLLVGFPLLFFLLLFSLTIPILIVESCTILQALKRSAQMVWLSQFKSALVLYAGIILFFYLTTPNTRHTLWFYRHHLKAVFDLVVYLLLGPLLLSYALLLVNDLSIFLRERDRIN